MKHLFFPVLLIISLSSYAQSPREGYFNKTKLSIPLRLSTTPEYQSGFFDKSGHGTEITNINGWHFNQKLAIGLGISVTSYVGPTISTYPVFGNLNYYFKDSPSSPYVYGNAGYGLVFKKNYEGGAMLEIGSGLNLKLGKKSRLTPEVGYKFQKINASSNHDISISSLNIGLGLMF
ncbi:hypothetical protein EIM50_26175 [Pseudoxanthomonas sp. SGD-10]|nr:hypothetical protein EIM50_26175 [Pseudoxanthomonas sp. SGD-10]